MIAAVIPTRYHPPELDMLLPSVIADGALTFVMRSEDHGHAIYRMWNAGVAAARAAGATEIAILNDDVILPPGALPALAAALRSASDVGVVYPDCRDVSLTGPLTDTVGTWGAGGMTGFAFMFRAEIDVPFDEGFGWWYGDDAFEEAARAAGWRVCRVNGLPVRHVANGSAGRDWDRLAPLIEADRTRWDALHS